jgi:outer membrane immunogenic protein
MKKLLLSSSVLVALGVAGSALAADLPVYTKAPPPAPVWSWTGWYFGVNGGWGWGRSSHTSTIIAPVTTGDFDVSGGLVGGTAGYNYQIGHWVFGVETDLDWADINGSFNGVGFSLTSHLKWLDTTRARAGWVIDHTLLYATAGAAFGGLTATASAPGIGSAADTQTRFGWTAGAGLEHAFTPSVSGKIEYLYVDLGTQTQIVIDNVKFTTNIVRGGLNWRF